MRLSAVVACVALAACSSTPERESGGLSVADVVGDWSADLQPVAGSGLRGELKVQSALAGSAVRLTLSGATANALLPWHVHRGTCASGGPIHGSADAYPVLQVREDGTAEVTATIGSALNEQERYHVNVHRSATELNVILACGDLRN